jgi:hypothetical protein
MVSGARIRADYTLGMVGPLELSLFANYGYFENWKSKEQRIQTPMGGLELAWQEGQGQLQVSSGLRHVQNLEEARRDGQDIFLELEAEQVVSSNHSLKLSTLLLQRLRYEPLEETERDWFDANIILAYKWSPFLALSLSYERQGDPNMTLTRRNYFSGAIRGYVNSATYIDLRVGENGPGLKCINGICRSDPGFSGVTFSSVVRF